MCHVSALRSLPGGPQQEFHSVFSVYHFPKFAGIISLSDKTTLEIKGKGREEDMTLRILCGKMVVFRDFMHAGSSYTEENTRIYFKAILWELTLIKARSTQLGADIFVKSAMVAVGNVFLSSKG